MNKKYFFVSYIFRDGTINSYGYIFYPSKFKTFNILEFYNQIGNKINSVILNYKEISKVEFENLNKV
ncbi:hypothetical protein DAC16_101 [Bacteroides phage DAC16]|nr:hypothetical protein DAC16_101 [Bacteroides phage DAC16]